MGTSASALETALADLAVANGRLADANELLASKDSFTDALLETVEVGIVSCDADGKNWIRNRAEREILGLAAGAGRGFGPEQAAPLTDIFDASGNRLPVERYPLLRALRGEDPGEVELLIGPAGGPHREVISSNSQIVGTDGSVLGAVSALTDVSAERAVIRALADEHRRLSEAQRVGHVGSFEYDFSDGAWTFSEQLAVLWGVEPSELSATTLNGLLVEQDREEATQIWEEKVWKGGRQTHDWRILRGDDGAERVMRSNMEVDLGPDGHPTHVRGTHVDITDVMAARTEAQESGAFLDAVLSAAPDYTFVTDLATGMIIYGSHDIDVLGMTGAELQLLDNDARLELAHPDDRYRVVSANRDAGELNDGQVLQLRYRARHVNGEWRWLNRRVTPFRRDKSGAVVEVLAVLRDVTDSVEAESRIAHKALHDDLTGLPNRALLVDRLCSALARSVREGQEVAVLCCDLDSFKRVNDTGGHAAGDAVLLEIARRLGDAVGEGDTVARVGGDEFVIIVEPRRRPNPGERDGVNALAGLSDRFVAVRIAERVVDVVRRPIIVNGVSHVVTASIGITYAKVAHDENGYLATTDQMLQDADAAMYRAKSRGKDRFALFEQELRKDLAERGRVEQVLRQALRPPVGLPRPGFVPVPRSSSPTLSAAYQPIFNSGTGELVGFEALARLSDGDGQTIPPDVFIAVAEDTGAIHALGAVMLGLACSQLRRWRTEIGGLDQVSMSVNVSGLQAQMGSLGDDVRRVLSEHQLTPGDLVLELTETALLQAAPSTITILRALHTEGVGISIDDFGTGYASLRYLATLPVTAIKIDRSFTAGLPHDETSRKIVKAVAGLAADLDLACIVEGVETIEQRNALPEGVHLQGFLTGRPAAPEALDLAALVSRGAP